MTGIPERKEKNRERKIITETLQSKQLRAESKIIHCETKYGR